MSDNNNLILGLGLIVGAVYYSRRKQTTYAQQQPAGPRPLGTGSVPGSVGTGIAQQLGGLLGNLLAPKTGGGTLTGAPPVSTVIDQYPYMVGDGVMQNSIEAADPMNTFDPDMDQGTLSDWIGGLA